MLPGERSEPSCPPGMVEDNSDEARIECAGRNEIYFRSGRLVQCVSEEPRSWTLPPGTYLTSSSWKCIEPRDCQNIPWQLAPHERPMVQCSPDGNRIYSVESVRMDDPSCVGDLMSDLCNNLRRKLPNGAGNINCLRNDIFIKGPSNDGTYQIRVILFPAEEPQWVQISIWRLVNGQAVLKDDDTTKQLWEIAEERRRDVETKCAPCYSCQIRINGSCVDDTITTCQELAGCLEIASRQICKDIVAKSESRGCWREHLERCPSINKL